MDRPIKYLAVPGQTALVPGVCSATGMPLTFVCIGTWMGDGKCHWYCNEIVSEAEFIRNIESGRRVVHNPTKEESLPAFSLGPRAVCPGCAISDQQYYRCGICKALNCQGAVKERRIGPCWARKSETISRCGSCFIEKVFAPTCNLHTVEGARDLGPIEEPKSVREPPTPYRPKLPAPPTRSLTRR